MRTRITPLISSVAALLALGLAPGAASASTAPPPASDTCDAYIWNIHRVDTGHIAATFTMDCGGYARPIYMSPTGIIERDGYYVEPHAHLCHDAQECSETLVAKDKPGKQKYTFLFDPDASVVFGGATSVVYQCLKPTEKHMLCERTTATF